MRFEVKRTSSFVYGKEQPCDEAVKERCNHDKRVKFWYVNIKNMNDLLKFVNKYELIIINAQDDGSYEIEIYDDHRE